MQGHNRCDIMSTRGILYHKMVRVSAGSSSSGEVEKMLGRGSCGFQVWHIKSTSRYLKPPSYFFWPPGGDTCGCNSLSALTSVNTFLAHSYCVILNKTLSPFFNFGHSKSQKEALSRWYSLDNDKLVANNANMLHHVQLQNTKSVTAKKAQGFREDFTNQLVPVSMVCVVCGNSSG